MICVGLIRVDWIELRGRVVGWWIQKAQGLRC